MASSAPPVAATADEDVGFGSSQSSVDATISVDLVPRLSPRSDFVASLPIRAALHMYTHSDKPSQIETASSKNNIDKGDG